MSDYGKVMNQNYGGIWVGNINKALELNCNDLTTEQLIQLFMALNILPDKARQLIRQYKDDLGYLKQDKNGKWNYSTSNKKDFIIPNGKQEQKPKTDLQKEDRDYYRYVKKENSGGRTPKTKPEWLEEIKNEEELDPRL